MCFPVSWIEEGIIVGAFEEIAITNDEVDTAEAILGELMTEELMV